MDLRLHMRTHLARVSEVIDDGTRLHRAVEEREHIDLCDDKRMDFTKTAEGMKLNDEKWKFGHYVHNGTTWVREQVEHYPLIRSFIIEVDRLGYRSMGFVEPCNTRL